MGMHGCHMQKHIIKGSAWHTLFMPQQQKIARNVASHTFLAAWENWRSVGPACVCIMSRIRSSVRCHSRPLRSCSKVIHLQCRPQPCI